jgi:hypothetical protein
MIDTPLLKRIKMIQANDAKTWKGLPVEYVSRPGKDRILDYTYIFIGLLLNVQPNRKTNKTMEYLKVKTLSKSNLNIAGR